MKKNVQRLLILVLLIGSVYATSPIHTDAFSSRDLGRGATGDDVIELQARLQYIGFYRGDIDGKFGYGTYWALRNFQDKYGLPIDGIAGSQTKKKLTAASSYDEKFVMENLKKGNKFTHYGGKPLASQVKKGGGKTENIHLPSKYTEQDLKLMANAVYGEARGEPYEGQVAVAAVILNRVEHADFPNTVSGVIFQPGAFTAVADGQIWLTPNERAKEAVLDALNGWDPSENAIYYFNPITATSKWIWSRPQIKKIGLHIFCN
ncbi:spore cortex-lytic enzyme [Sporosarcina thermotolerans]|uniref:Spore cortex-lytic enzyme n=1 Tax=Sporosarcina thermotolerans TaxID=633404 RepID=A0AAW9A3G1_9BACL|nr:spore cortex-lytic enzyme [Sporosarcina thermotolerans]MDW0115576.1 spore cortex-lytic enzyme [Sporosarcina thermotolerans]